MSYCQREINAKSFKEELQTITHSTVWFIFINLLSTWPGFAFVFSGLIFSQLENPDILKCASENATCANSTNNNLDLLLKPNKHKHHCYYYILDKNEHVCKLSYNEAKKFVEKLKKHNKLHMKKCKKFIGKHNKITARIEFGITCNEAKENVIIYVSTAAKLFAALIFCPLGDVYGRKFLLRIGSNTLIIASLMICICTTFAEFLICIFVMYVGYILLKIGIEIILLELTDCALQELTFLLSYMGFFLGFVITPCIAEMSPKNWRHYHLVLLIPMLLVPFVAWFIPESPRWYLVMRKNESRAWALLQTLKSPNTHNELLYIFRNYKPIIGYVDHIIELFCNMTYFNYLLLYITALCSGVIFFRNYQWKIFLEIVPPNDHLRLSLSGIIDICTVVICTNIMLYLNNQKTIAVGFFCSFICLLTSYFMNNKKDLYITTLLSETFCCICEMSTAFYVLTRAPTSHRCTISGLIRVFIPAIGAMVGHTIIIHYHKVMYLVLSIFALIGFLSSLFLEQRKEKIIYDYYQ